MNSLEFINKYLEETNDHIEYLKRKIIEDAIYESLVEFHKKEIETLTKIKESLQQIKEELEAWEVVKENIGMNGNETGYEMNIIFWHDKEKFAKIKKALEVKNDK